MVKAQVVASDRRIDFDFSRSSSQILTVQTVRMAFLAIVLSITVMYQVISASFVPFNLFISIYSLLAVSFIFNCTYLVFLDKALSNWYWTGLLFFWETVYISFLIYFIGVNQSLLVFLYLINIILCGVVFQRKGGIYLAIITSVCFSFILAVDPQIQGNTLYLAVGINNLAFFTVAYMSGYLSEQLNFMGLELRERGRDIRILRNLNTLILDNMSTGLITVDNHGLVLQKNKRALDILGKKQDLFGSDLKKGAPELFKLVREFNQKEVREITISDSSGGIKTLRVQLSPLLDEKSLRKGFVLVFEDITTLNKLRHRVQQSEKLAAIGQLAAGIAHEIRNPLASISGSVQLLESERNSSPENKTLMSIVLKEINRLDKLITEFLDYASPEAMANTKVNLSQLLSELSDSIKLDALSNGVEFEVDIESSVFIFGNQDKLKQAFLNIIRNGLQSMNDVSTKRLLVSLEQHEDGVAVTLKDYGHGISADRLQKIFEPFHTTKPKGTGLGLAIVHSIFESHRADIEVQSEVGEWTEFVIRFPPAKISSHVQEI